MSRTTLLIFLIVVASIVSYLFYLNPHSISIALTSTHQVQAPAALVIIFVFFSGFVSASVIAFFVAARKSYIYWREIHRIRGIQQQLNSLVLGREELAAGNFQKAQAIFRRIIDQEPQHILAHLMLAKTLYHRGQPADALRVLDEARAGHEKNVELLFLAAELNAAMKNFTAASDNLTMVLKLDPQNVSALEKLGSYSRKLSRLEEARQYTERLTKLVSDSRSDTYQRELASLELALGNERLSGQPIALKSEVEQILKRHRDYPPALSVLAELERNDSRLDLATRLWVRAYKFSGDRSYLNQIVEMWLKIDQPARALEAVRNGVAARSGDTEIDFEGRFYLVQLLLKLEMIDEAESELQYLHRRLGEGHPYEILQFVLRTRVVARKGNVHEALTRFFELTEFLLPELKGKSLPRTLNVERFISRWEEGAHEVIEPSARFSTP